MIENTIDLENAEQPLTPTELACGSGVEPATPRNTACDANTLGIEPTAKESFFPWRKSCYEEGIALLAEDYLNDDADQALEWMWRYCGAHELLPAWIEMQELLSEEEWLKLLGYIWPSCDNISYYKYDIIRALPICPASPRMIVPSLMTSEELAAFDALPDRITIYRGCGPRNKSGLCWTLRREVAEKFPFSRRYQADNPILLTATITKTRVVALKLGRKEDEIIVVGLRKRNWTEERLTSASLDNEAQDESQWAA